MKLSTITATTTEGDIEVFKKKTRVYRTNSRCSNGYEDLVEKKPFGDKVVTAKYGQHSPLVNQGNNHNILLCSLEEHKELMARTSNIGKAEVC